MERNLSGISSKVLWPLTFVLIMLKYAYYGFSYYPLVDDNNMYGIYRMYSNVFKNVIINYHTYNTRPAAALLDPYFWAKFWDNPGIALVIMTILHFLTCVLVYKIFEKCGLNIGLPVILIFALLPFGSEATYWLSASTRIVVGFFFLSLSLYLLCLYLEQSKYDNKRYLFLILFFVTHLISLGFYEQVIALSFFALIFVFIAKRSQLRHKWIVLLPLINFGAIAFWYKLFGKSGNLADRGQIVQGHYIAHTKSVIKAIYQVWRMSLSDLYRTGFIKGLQTMVSNHSYLFLACIVVLSAIVVIISSRERTSTEPGVNIFKLLLGAVLFWIPYAPFFATSLIWICNRNMFLSFIGLGLIADAVIGLICRNKLLNIIKGAALGLMVFVFLTANVYELTYYRNVGAIDREITSNLSRAEGMDAYLKGKATMVLFNTRISYVDSIAKRIGNCTGADWSLTGAVAAQNNVIKLKYAYPLPDETDTLFKKDLLGTSILLGMDNARNIFPVRVSKEEDSRVYIIKSDGSEYGQLELLKDGYVKFHLKK